MGEGLFSPLHLLLILGIALLLFGPSKLAGLGKGLGEGIRNFKSAMNRLQFPQSIVTLFPELRRPQLCPRAHHCQRN